MTNALLLRFSVAVMCLALGAGSASADRVADVNRLYAGVPEDQRSDLVLLPAVAEMRPAPIEVREPEAAALIQPGDPGWAEAASWAGAEPQQRVIAAIRRMTDETDYRRAMVFAQPYGRSGVDRSLIEAGLFTDIGDEPALLAGARFHLLERLDPVRSLVHVEASRLAAAGEVAEACGLLIRLAYFGRQFADREFGVEMIWGLETAIDALRRVRDVLYVDFRSDRRASASSIRPLIAGLEPVRGYLGVERLTFPRADRIAAEQLIETLYARSGQPAEDFGTTMARIGSSRHPLRLFSESARWAGASASQASADEARAELSRVLGGWSARWALSDFDPVHSAAIDFGSLRSDRFAAVTEALPDLGVLFDLRRVLRTEAIGTRQSIGILGTLYETGSFPRTISSIRPRWVAEIEADPFNPNRAHGARPPMEYFVPIRDQFVAPGRQPEPHRLEVVLGPGATFSVELSDDQFLLYSIGPNATKDWGRLVSNDPRSPAGDFLIWPPVRSLLREQIRQGLD